LEKRKFVILTSSVTDCALWGYFIPEAFYVTSRRREHDVVLLICCCRKLYVEGERQIENYCSVELHKRIRFLLLKMNDIFWSKNWRKKEIKFKIRSLPMKKCELSRKKGESTATNSEWNYVFLKWLFFCSYTYGCVIKGTLF
jgi:hypothetical protein